MKITMKDFKDNVAVGAGTGLVVSAMLYIINRSYAKSVNDIKDEDVKESERDLQNAKNNLNLIKVVDIHK